MNLSVPSPSRVAALLTRPLPYGGGRRPPLADPTPDAGLFGPESVTWRVMREPLLILGGGRALLLQAAHPLVAEGAITHSTYATDPFGRLQRTIRWVTMVTYGTTAEARTASREVNRAHRRVAGRLDPGRATGAVRAGSAFTAMDEDLLLWVHATFVDTMLVTHDALVGGLRPADRDAFVAEWAAVGRLMRVPERLLWDSHAEMRAYIDGQVRRGPVRPGPGSRLVAQTILRPPLSPGLRAPWEAVSFTTLGLLPPELRRGYGVRWTPAHDAAHLALRRMLRTTAPVLPRRLRVSPVHDLAMARVRGEMERPAA